ncbi:MAG: Eco57I restriction-modification methylase domain-containing protein [Bacteroidaceae bacterium]|nr:Eco57I restriction-modification methylase domain-containing protein [Bacteroidaceae bacterium]
MDYRPVIESRYNRRNWQLLLHDIFSSKVKFWNTPSAISTNSPFARQAMWLGTITLSDEHTIAIYEVELAENVDIERNRRGIRDMLITTWRNNGNAGAFMFCYRRDESVLRFSYVSESWKFADDGTYQKESTDAKRFTYLLGEGHRSRTAIQQFEKLKASALSLKDLTKAFSVEAVSDMFFAGYKKQYEDIIFYVTGKRMVKVANKWEELQEGKPNAFIMQQFAHFTNPEKAIRDYVKKLMGRLVFLQFLQKKGWMGVPVNKEWGDGDAEFVLHLFENYTDKDHFIDNVLEPLFDDLNSERTNDLASPAVGRNIRVPYLNGGLFEREETDETQFPLPGKYMQSLLDFFASYNFTIDENDPDDAEVGVDPEMLGRIFENLLEDNKDKGAFYTPKEIVSYMCRESLIAYLQTGIEDEATKEAIRQFVTTHDVNVLGTNDRFCQQVDEALKNVKICDPAIGSGAFPMGLLKELFLCRTVIEGIEQSKAAEIKKHIIQQNIYGVDIERGAVDIARLRFWLSLIVDEETPQALPNLDFKIMQGNSLLEQYKGADLSTMTEKQGLDNLTFFDSMIDVYRKELRDMLAQYYECIDHKKKHVLRLKIIENVKQQLREQSINVDFGDLDLSGNNQFFLWHTWFYDVFSQGGFDIVIGNPPYIRVQNLEHDLIDLYKKVFSTAWKRVDISTLFIEKMMCQISTKGVLCYITSNQFVSAEYGRLLRKYMLNNRLLNKIVDFAGLPVFESAITYVSIFFLSHIETESFDYYKVPKLPFANPELFNKCSYDDFTEEPWSFVFSEDKYLLKKIQSFSPLSDIAFAKGGIITGNDDSFIFKPENFPAEKEVSLDLIRTDDIQRYYLGHPQLKIFYPCNYDCNGETEIIPIDSIKQLYPQAYNHIQKNELVLKARKDSRNVMGDKKHWYQPVRFGTLRLFKGKKILGPGIVNHNKFVLDDEGYAFSFGNMYAIATNNPNVDLKVLLGILNSKLVEYYLHKVAPVKQGGYFSYGATVLEKIPLCYPMGDIAKKILVLVERVISEKQKDCSFETTALESEIDCFVYQLYGLTYDEVLIVDPETPITREEYEKTKLHA